MKNWILFCALSALAVLACGCATSRVPDQTGQGKRSYVSRQTHAPRTEIMVVPASDVIAMKGGLVAGNRPPPTIEMPEDRSQPSASNREAEEQEALRRSQEAYLRTRTPEQVVAYRMGRSVDPRNPDVMHESHDVYRVATEPAWVLESPPVRTGGSIRDSRTEIKSYDDQELAPRMSVLEQRSEKSEAADTILADAVRELQKAFLVVASEVAELKGEPISIPVEESDSDDVEIIESEKGDENDG